MDKTEPNEYDHKNRFLDAEHVAKSDQYDVFMQRSVYEVTSTVNPVYKFGVIRNVTPLREINDMYRPRVRTRRKKYTEVERCYNMDASNIPKYITKLAGLKSDQEAFIFASTTGSRQVITWKELHEKSVKVAKGLISIGIQSGEIVALSLRTCPEWLYLAFGCMYIGAIPGTLVFTYRDGKDVIATLEKMEKCALIVMDPGVNGENWKILQKLVAKINQDGSIVSDKLKYVRKIIFHDPEEKLGDVMIIDDLLEDGHPDCELPKVDNEDPVFLFQTSGSTGASKIVVHTHRGLFEAQSNPNVLNKRESKKYFNCRPFAWLGVFPFNVFTGETRVTVSGFCPDPEDKFKFFIDVVRRENCRSAEAYPQEIFTLMTRHQELTNGEQICEILLTGGQPMTAAMATCVGKLCSKLVIGYGSTETLFNGCASVTNPETYNDFFCGPVTQGDQVKVTDENGEIVPNGKRGEIFVRTQQMFKEYLNDPEKTAAAFTSDGWYRTGDVGRLTEEGLFVEGKKKFEIIRGGMNILPDLLEVVLQKCSGVLQAIVVPVTHPFLYQEICACIVLEPEAKVSEDDIRKFIAEYYADSKREFSYLPAVYMFIAEIATFDTGKAARTKLAALAEERFKF